MQSNSKKIQLVILGITSVLLSRTMLLAFNDPEGPNLLIIFVLAAGVYGFSFMVYRFIHSNTNVRRFALALSSQVLIVIILYYLGK